MCEHHNRTHDDFDPSDPFAGLDDGPVATGDVSATTERVARQAKAKGETFPCQSCGGTGKWSNPRRVNRHGEDRCFTCNGRGYFATSYKDRVKAREQRQARKLRKAKQLSVDLDEAHNGLFIWMCENAHWNNFARDLVERIGSGKDITDNQLAAIKRTRAKCEARQAERQAARDAEKTDVDVSIIKGLFDTALERGLNKRALLAGVFNGDELVHKIKLTPAPETGKNPGAVYVKVDGEYAGKIMNGKFSPFKCPDGVGEALVKIAKDPEGEARLYGQRTGVCSACGRELTNEESIKLGIGPICREKWF